MTWPMVALEDLMVKRAGSIDPKKHLDSNFVLYSIPAFDRGGPEFVKGSEIGSSKKIVEPKDVLLSRIVPHIRRACVVGEHNTTNVVASSEWISFRSPNFFPDYLRQLLVADGFHAQFMQTVAGVGGSLLRARPEAVSRIKIPLPPLEEQKRIARILDQADALRRKRRDALTLLDTLTQSIFVEMFGDPVTNPMGWPNIEIADLFDLKHGFAFKSENFLDEGPYVLLTPGNFFERGGFRHRGEKQRYHLDPVPDEYVLEKADILVAMTEQAPGLLGSPIVVPEGKKFLHNQRLGKVVCKTPIEKAFIVELMNARSIRSRIAKDSTGTKVKHTSPKKIGAIEIGIPPLGLQKKFSEICDRFLTQKRHLEVPMQGSETLFASLQSRAFSGDL